MMKSACRVKKSMCFVKKSVCLFLTLFAFAGAFADPVLYMDGKKNEMFSKAFALMREAMVTKPASGFTAPFFPPGAGYGQNWWQLDSSTVLEAWKWCDFDFCTRSIENFRDVQKKDGRIPLFGGDVLPATPNHSKQRTEVSSLPVLFRTVHSLAIMRGDPAFTRRMYELSKRYCDWWRLSRVDRATGLVSSVFEETFPPYLGSKGEFAGVDTGVMVALGAEWTAELADLLGEKSEAADLRAFSERTFAAMRAKMWDDRSGLFRPYAFADGSRGFESAEGFYMLADRNLAPTVRGTLLKNLTGPRFAWGRMPLASMAVDSPCYTNTVGRTYQFNASWSGNVWSLINRWTVHALLRTGCEKEAVALALKTKEMIDRAGTFDEFYLTTDGSAQGGEKYLWTAADYVILLLEDLLGISYDGSRQELSVKPRIPGDFRLEGLSLPGGGFATIESKNGQITVERFAGQGQPTPAFDEARPVWAKDREREQNLSLRFEANLNLTGCEKSVLVRATGSSVYRLRVNGQFAGYGPARGPKGVDRVDEWSVGRFVKNGMNTVEIDVAGYAVPNYYLPDQPSYLRAEVIVNGRVLAATGNEGFRAKVLNREKKVPRYSFQRPFCEVWNASRPVLDEQVELAVQPCKPLLPRRAAYPDFALNLKARKIGEGRVRYDAKAKVRNYWPLDVTGPTKDARGFPQEECTIIPAHEAERYVDDPAGTARASVWDFGLLDCGFVGVKATARGKGRVLVSFDEVLTDGRVDFLRGGTSNVVIWNVDGPGELDLESFEPYAFRYAKFVVDGDVEIGTPFIRTYKSPSADAFVCPTRDRELKKIFEAARETFKQNAVDVFTDCPGRERAGWLCDSFFTSRTSKLLTGSLELEELFLENYLLADCPDIPKGVFPMCYPSDHVNRNFIPNWAMWLVLELEDYLGRGGDPELVKRFGPKVLALVDYLRTFENADGLLENLPAWVFVEWSRCNDLTKGVNYPSNMTWARVLEAAAALYGREDLKAKAAAVREAIRAQSFDGTWFRDQALRGKDGKLVVQPDHTETCQYYAFYFGTATAASHPKLWKTLVDEFGPDRKIKNSHPDVPFSNAFIGNYLRIELLLEAGLDEIVEKNVRGYFLGMAEKTGTLWEHDSPTASCCHGFASYIAVVIDRLVKKGGWRPYAGNPVLGNPKLGTCFDVNVVTDGPAPYTMYFSWRGGGHTIALVRSDDGFTWTQEPEICLRPDPASGWENMLNRSCTVKKDGIWHMWYTGQVFDKNDWHKGTSKIGYATSKDGVHFERVRKEPVMTPELPWEKTSVMNPYVRWDATRGVWRMWYAAGEIYEPNVLGYAESEDGLVWKKIAEPVFGHGEPLAWDRDRVGACEVHPLEKGGWVMFYIGYSDVDTARIGCAFSRDGVTGWRRYRGNPIVQPEVGTWNGAACYKPSVVRDEANKRWLLWYNGRNGNPEYVGMSVHAGLDLEAPASAPSDVKKLFRDYVRRFNAHDDEVYTNAVPNAAAEDFLLANCPRFACPDKDVERTFAFRWWTYRKHLKFTKAGEWVVSEFLPDVGWAGYANMIVCPFIHHVREGRWLRDGKYLKSYVDTMVRKGRVSGPGSYASAPAWCALEYAAVTGDDGLARSLLDRFVENYRAWEKGWEASSVTYSQADAGRKGKFKTGYKKDRGLFDFVGCCEGTEYALSADGARPMVNAAMWAESRSIAEIARGAGEEKLAAEFERKAEGLEANVRSRLWRDDLGFFTALSVGGKSDDVRELHGYAPFYFGMPLEARYDVAFEGLTDPKGFLAPLGLAYPRQDTPGFDLKIDVKKHECLWNGPSWPYATSVALTALANRLHSRLLTSDLKAPTFASLLSLYAAQHRRQRVPKEDGDYTVVPWIDENLSPVDGNWIARRVMIEWAKAGRKGLYRERGKDYNHSTFCDLVISGLVGIVPQGEKGFAVDPLCPPEWDYFVLEGVRYRGHEVSVRWQRGEGLTVTVDGRLAGQRPDLGRVDAEI